MPSHLPEIISLTTLCTAGCLFCPYSDPKVPSLFLDIDTVLRIAKNTQKKLIVLTGGEPLLHPNFPEIIQSLSEISTPFRIATGGFVDLNRVSDLLKMLHSSGSLQGVSIGTDVIGQQSPNPKLARIWSSNIHLLEKKEIPYSLTMTIDPPIEFKWLDLWKLQEKEKLKPQFIYLRYRCQKVKALWIKQVKESFGNIQILEENLSYLENANKFKTLSQGLPEF